MDLAKLAKGGSIIGLVGTSAAIAPPVDIINAVTQLLLAAVGLYEMFKGSRKNKPAP